MTQVIQNTLYLTTPATFVASGLLTSGAGTVNASGLNGANAITNVQAPISWYDTMHHHHNNT